MKNIDKRISLYSISIYGFMIGIYLHQAIAMKSLLYSTLASMWTITLILSVEIIVSRYFSKSEPVEVKENKKPWRW